MKKNCAQVSSSVVTESMNSKHWERKKLDNYRNAKCIWVAFMIAPEWKQREPFLRAPRQFNRPEKVEFHVECGASVGGALFSQNLLLKLQGKKEIDWENKKKQNTSKNTSIHLAYNV